MIIRKSFLFTLLTVGLSNCQPQNANQLLGDNSEKSAVAACDLTQGEYVVQSATHRQANGSYELMLLGAPGCLKQPVVLMNLKLERIEENEKEKAKLRFQSKENASLLLAQDFQITLVESVVENGSVVREHSSSWSPFLAGAAGAVVGSMAGSAISGALSRRNNQAQTPPQPQAAQPTMAKPQNGKEEPRRGFFNRKTSPDSNHTKIYQRKSYTPRSGGSFFKRRR